MSDDVWNVPFLPCTVQVVPTLYSLKLLMRRSREVQRLGDWVEFLDPDTNAFWYLQEVRITPNHAASI